MSRVVGRGQRWHEVNDGYTVIEMLSLHVYLKHITEADLFPHPANLNKRPNQPPDESSLISRVDMGRKHVYLRSIYRFLWEDHGDNYR